MVAYLILCADNGVMILGKSRDVWEDNIKMILKK
jgi:hypothetical protein